MSKPTSPVDAQTSMTCFCHIYYLLNNVADKIHPGYDHTLDWDVSESDGTYYMSVGNSDIPLADIAAKLAEIYPDQFNVKR